ncbi:type II CRISPR RNA-guided endonuclease Cas9 [Azospirillum agricola]|uniref:type II CRISPR RNA-guided endonuclease Cas9 n=1 Tax=Azospirillum agricola TaxID=1720247 RepID=UPI000A0F29DA|nr:type II CRISPR RNA-guided endonuclease Cas9 [Azospirillum agricola]SMH60270.1 CRISPR-associated endonuclease Csn1 [Azospirillum lipoferum]
MSKRLRYRLALDLGTNSIGFCLLDLNGEGRPCGIRRMGVRIFPDGRDPKSKASLAADRRLARSMRRRRDRYLRRRTVLMNALAAAGLMPPDPADRKALEHDDPYTLRARAVAEPLPPHQLGRALFHLNQRRGFKSNRKAAGDENEAGKVKTGISALKEELAASGAGTLGQWLAARHARREPVRARLTGAGAKASYSFYPDRSLVHEEFQVIRAVQAPHQPGVTPAQWDRIESIIFHQRPLKPVKPGKCTLYPTEERAPWALPIAQQFRILTELANLRFERPGEPQWELTADESAALFARLCRKGDLTFKAMRKDLKLPPDTRINLEDEKRDRLKGDAVADALSADKGKRRRIGPPWHDLPPARQRAIVGRLLDTEDEEELAVWLVENVGLGWEVAILTAERPGLPDGHCSLSEKALEEVVPLMRDQHLRYDEAVSALGLHHSDFRPDSLLDELPYYGEPLERFIAFGTGEPSDPPELRLGRFPNPTVHIGLNELRKLVNRIIQRWGKPEEIVVELARDLKRSRDEREKLQRDQAQNQRRNEERANRLRELGVEVKAESRLRLRLWEELPQHGLARVCVYTGEVISLTRLLQGDVDIDHILPFSKTLSDGPDNKIVCVRGANRFKRNRTPWEAFGVVPVDGYDWAAIGERAEQLPRNKRWRFQPDAMERFNGEKGFLDRQLTETRHLSRIARQYLGSILPLERVRVAPVRLTALLRARWGLNKILSDSNLKNRSDHRHHAVDAAVLGVVDQRLVQQVAKAAERAEVNELERLFDGLPDPFDGLGVDSFGDQVRDKARGIVVSHKAEHGWQGRMHNDTAYGPVAVQADGAHVVVTRKPLASLTAKDLPNIRDPKLAAALEAHVEAQAAQGRGFAEALSAFEWTNGTVRRVRMLDKLGSPIPVRDPAGAVFKLYKGDSNAWYEILRDGRGRWTGRIVSTHEAYQLHRQWVAETGSARTEDGRPFQEWAARRVVGNSDTPLFRLFKGDLLALGVAPDRQILRVVKFSEGQIVLASHHEAGNLKARDADKGDPFKYRYSSPEALRKAQARPAGVDLLGYVHDKGPVE